MYKKKFSSLIILIPSHNELNNFKSFLVQLNKKYNILVIDDCSSDGTIEFLKKNKILFLKNKKNIGYEKSLIKGFKYIKKIKKYKKILTMDADGQHKLKYVSLINKICDKNDADLVVGIRERKNRNIEKIISYIFKKKYEINDPLSGFKIYKTKTLFQFNLNNIKKYFLVDLLIQFCEEKKKIITKIIQTRPRKDKPRIGNFIKVNFKMIKILKFITSKK